MDTAFDTMLPVRVGKMWWLWSDEAVVANKDSCLANAVRACYGEGCGEWLKREILDE